MTLTEWAENEVKIACERERKSSGNSGEWDYGCACYESALKAYKSLMEDGHSGMSFSITRNILIRLMNDLPLTPIEDTEDIWSDIADTSGLHGEVVNYQCKRKSSLFKYIYADGSVKYSDIDRVVCIDINCPSITYRSGFVARKFNELYPITMPYIPEGPIKIYTETFLYDINNGDFDTKGIFYAIKPDGTRIELNKFFKESDMGFVEIDRDEYESRKENRIKDDEEGNENE